jgi:xanthine dehydrogenase accessory factor
MFEILIQLKHWQREGKQVALATVVKTWGSSPREVGAVMLVTEQGEFVGSVSGGCVEGAVIEEAVSILRNRKSKILHYGVADETAWEVGLACGGEIDVFVEPVADGLTEILGVAESYRQNRITFVIARVIRGPEDHLGGTLIITEEGEPTGTLHKSFQEQVTLQGRILLKEESSTTKEISLEKDHVECFFEFHGPRLRLVIVGGVHISSALAIQAKSLGYQVFLVDPRSAFGTEERFPDVDGLISDWPDEALIKLELDRFTAVAVLTHDPKLDDPALKVALPSSAFYVGALGSRETQRKRRLRLASDGLSKEHLARLRGPIGLDLGGRRPDEIALSIMAEIVAVRAHSPLV